MGEGQLDVLLLLVLAMGKLLLVDVVMLLKMEIDIDEGTWKTVAFSIQSFLGK